MRRRSLARGIAALGAACLLLTPFATSARAASVPLPIYQATGIGQGVVTTFTLVPSILTPLLEVGTNYTRTDINSQGGGQSGSLAAQLYPGGLIVGALGCPSAFPPPLSDGWIQAAYPSSTKCPSEAHSTLASMPPSGNQQLSAFSQIATLTTADLSAIAKEATGLSAVNTQGFTVGGSTPIMTVGDLATNSSAASSDKTVRNTVSATAKDLSLLNGLIHIETIRSTSTATSDGTTGDAKGTLTIAGVTVAANGTRYDATIDDSGIHVNQPGLSREQNLGLSEQITEAMTKAGLHITTSTPAKIIDGASGEATVGGLIISFNVSVPSVQIPPELAPVLAQIYNAIPTRCLPVGICFGQGALPGPGSNAVVTFNIASTDAFAVGGAGFTPTGGGLCATCGGSTPPTSVLPTQITAPPIGPGPAPTPPPAVTQQGPLALFGLVARLPAAALLWSGVILLFLAVAYSFGPSLRHDRAG